MSGYGYPQNPPPHGYGSAPPTAQPYGQPHGQPTAQPYGQPTGQPYGQPPYGAPPHYEGGVKPPKESKPYGSSDQGHGYPSAAYGQPPYGSSHEGGVKPPKENKPYGAPDHGHGYSSPAYGQPPYGSGHDSGVKPPKENKPYGSGDQGHGYPSAPPHQGGSDHGHGYPSAPAYGQGPHQGGSDHGHGYPAASPFAAVLPSTFPPGTDPSIVACFQVADRDGSGLIDDKELQGALSSYNQSFSIRTVHLLMYSFTDSNARRIGPKEFVAVYYSLQSWREIFERFDRDRSGKIDSSELREALYNLGFSVSPVVLDLLVSKFDKTGGKSRAIEYDNFIECCLTVKGLTEKFKSRDKTYTGTATFTYEDFMLAVLPFLIA